MRLSLSPSRAAEWGVLAALGAVALIVGVEPSLGRPVLGRWALAATFGAAVAVAAAREAASVRRTGRRRWVEAWAPIWVGAVVPFAWEAVAKPGGTGPWALVVAGALLALAPVLAAAVHGLAVAWTSLQRAVGSFGRGRRGNAGRRARGMEDFPTRPRDPGSEFGAGPLG